MDNIVEMSMMSWTFLIHEKKRENREKGESEMAEAEKRPHKWIERKGGGEGRGSVCGKMFDSYDKLALLISQTEKLGIDKERELHINIIMSIFFYFYTLFIYLFFNLRVGDSNSVFLDKVRCGITVKLFLQSLYFIYVVFIDFDGIFSSKKKN